MLCQVQRLNQNLLCWLTSLQRIAVELAGEGSLINGATPYSCNYRGIFWNLTYDIWWDIVSMSPFSWPILCPPVCQDRLVRLMSSAWPGPSHGCLARTVTWPPGGPPLFSLALHLKRLHHNVNLHNSFMNSLGPGHCSSVFIHSKNSSVPVKNRLI